MPIEFMLQPEGEAYWRVADEDQNLALNKFCEQNYVGYLCFNPDGCLPVSHYRGVVKVKVGELNLNGDFYISFKNDKYDVHADEDGRQFSSKGERHFAPLIIETQGEKCIARPYVKLFIDPRLRPVRTSLYQVSVPHPRHGPARGAGARRRP